jgi:hypothetical protein
LTPPVAATPPVVLAPPILGEPLDPGVSVPLQAAISGHNNEAQQASRAVVPPRVEVMFMLGTLHEPPRPTPSVPAHEAERFLTPVGRCRSSREAQNSNGVAAAVRGSDSIESGSMAFVRRRVITCFVVPAVPAGRVCRCAKKGHAGKLRYGSNVRLELLVYAPE